MVTSIADYKRRQKPSLDSLLGGYSGRWLDECNKVHKM
jgi:hypothetical protein